MEIQKSLILFFKRLPIILSCILAFACQGNNKNVIDISITTLLAEQIRFENQVTDGKKYAVGKCSIRVPDKILQKFLINVKPVYKDRLVNMGERLVENKATCNFTDSGKYPFLLLVEEGLTDSYNEDEIEGIFGVSCIEYERITNTGLYYFSHACGLECGYAGFVIFEKNHNQKITIVDVIYTGVS